MTQATQPKKDTSPRAGGPAGPQFEAKVATHYALAVLAQTEAFGLPCAIVDRLLPRASSKSPAQVAQANPGCSNPPPKTSTCCRGCWSLPPIEHRPAAGRVSKTSLRSTPPPNSFCKICPAMAAE